MNNMLLYFVESGIAMGLFYGIYRFFMEKETNHSLNRFYLVGTIILSLTLPFLPLEKIFMAGKLGSIPVFYLGLEDQGIADSPIAVENSSGGELTISGYILARIVYLSGIGILAATLLFQLFRLLLIKRTGRENFGPLKVIYVDKNINPFSILDRVYLSQEIRRNPKINTILDHEYAHYRYLHFIDLILLEFITLFQWFNPLAWLYVRSLKEIHEYQADAAVLLKGEATGSYQALLVNQLTGTEVFRLANGFSKSLTKKRMIMMTKMKSKNGTWLKTLLAMPVLAFLLVAYAANPSTPMPVEKDYIVKGKVIEAESGEPIPGVHVIWKGTTNGTVTDINGDYSLRVKDKDAQVVYSFVGFVTAVTTGAGEFTVRMGRKVFEISGEYEEPPSMADGDEKQDIQEKKDSVDVLDKELFYIVEDMPKFQGESHNACLQYIQERLEYPQEAKNKGIQGIVQVEFVVNSKGKVVDAKVVRGVDPLLDKAALQAVNAMPDWKPGKQRGKSVAVLFVVPVQFSMDAE